ncbi:hypothetical protein TURU_015721 [Turdus rufiventris]|nr:hypothetical protein TURU_015721 [Turdus rufiventris]
MSSVGRKKSPKVSSESDNFSPFQGEGPLAKRWGDLWTIVSEACCSAAAHRDSTAHNQTQSIGASALARLSGSCPGRVVEVSGSQSLMMIVRQNQSIFRPTLTDRTQGAGRVASLGARPFLPALPGTASDHDLSLPTACITSEGEQLPFLCCTQPAVTTSMATAADWNCPICHEASNNIVYVGNCLHRFCQSCIVRWTTKNRTCPLCRQTVYCIINPAPLNQHPLKMAVEQHPVTRRPAPRHEPDAAELQAHVAGLSPETWALCFRNYTEILRPVQMWLNKVLTGACWWDVAFTQCKIRAILCRYGLQEDTLLRELEPFLKEQTPIFVRRLMEVVSSRCSERAWRRVLMARQEASPNNAASPGPSRVQEERQEGSRQARAWGAGVSVGCGPDASRRRRRGGSQEARVAQKKQHHRQK